jgi:hypothetical protein
LVWYYWSITLIFEITFKKKKTAIKKIPKKMNFFLFMCILPTIILTIDEPECSGSIQHKIHAQDYMHKIDAIYDTKLRQRQEELDVHFRQILHRELHSAFFDELLIAMRELIRDELRLSLLDKQIASHCCRAFGGVDKQHICNICCPFGAAADCVNGNLIRSSLLGSSEYGFPVCKCT